MDISLLLCDLKVAGSVWVFDLFGLNTFFKLSIMSHWDFPDGNTVLEFNR